MDYLHSEFDLGSEDIVEIKLDGQANVRLLDDLNFARYQRRENHAYEGGFAATSPVRLSPAHPGHWHLVVDLGGYPGSVSSEFRVLHPAQEYARG